MTITPNEEYFIIASYYKLERFTTDITKKELIESPIQMEMIELKEWENNILEFTCDEFLNNNNQHLTMTYDYKIDKIEIRNLKTKR